MRGQANEASLGEGAAWANKPGYGWDAPAIKQAAEKVRGETMMGETGVDDRSTSMASLSLRFYFAGRFSMGEHSRLVPVPSPCYLTIPIPSFAPQPKTSSAARLKENLDVFDFELDDSDMAAIDKLDLEGSAEWKGKRVALEWNPVEAP